MEPPRAPHRLVALALAFSASACFVPRPPTTIPRPTLVDRQLTIPSTRKDLPAMVLEGAWELRDGRYCVIGGLVRLATAAGAIPFDDASLCVTLDPVSLEGDATVAFPALGFLARAGVGVEGRRAHVRLALGSQLGTLDLDGHRVRADPYHYYLELRFADGVRATIGAATISGPGGSGTMVIAPQEPLVYVAGSLSSPAFSAAGAFGLSPAGRIGFEPRQQLRDGRRAIRPQVAGHLAIAGSFPLAPYPVTVSGDLVLDLDANDDGRTAFDGAPRDVVIAANGAIALGYARNGFDLSLEVGDGTLLFDTRAGAPATLFLAASSRGLFEGTPLARFEPMGRSAVRAHWRSLDDFSIDVEADTRVLGFALSRTRFTLDAAGVRAAAVLELPAGMGRVDVAGVIDARGGFDLRGRGDLTIAGLRLLGADVRVGTSGVAVSGLLDLPGLGRVAVAGHVRAGGDVALSGVGELRPGGLRLAGARVALSTRGADIAGRVQFLGSVFAVRGAAAGSGFQLSGQLDVNLLVLRGIARLSIANTGVRAAVHGRACLGPSCVDLAGLDLDSRGRVCPIFPVAGRRCITIL